MTAPGYVIVHISTKMETNEAEAEAEIDPAISIMEGEVICKHVWVNNSLISQDI